MKKRKITIPPALRTPAVRAALHAGGLLGDAMLLSLRTAAAHQPPPQPTLHEYLMGGRKPDLLL